MTARHLGSLAVAVSVVLGCSGPVAATPTPSTAGVASPQPSPSPLPVSATPPPPRLDGRLLFARAGHGFGDETFFTANLDGTDERRLSTAELGGPARLSPDGRTILVNMWPPDTGPYIGGTLPIEGGEPKRLAIVDAELHLGPQAWSPTEPLIAFEGEGGEDPSRTGVYTARYPDMSGLRQLTESPEGMLDTPADWSPDGEWLVLFRHAPGRDWDVDGTLWLVRSDGTDLQPIQTPNLNPGWWARWSPDGTKILFASARKSVTGALWTVDADGTNLTQLFVDDDGRFPISPAWSPDGSKIVVALLPFNDEFQHPADQVFVMDADGTDLTMIIGGDDFKREFEWFE